MALTVGINSYISQADADAYFEDNLQFASWGGLDSATKDRALVTASGQISLLVRDGCKLPLALPIETMLANAAAELAIALALNPAQVTAANTGSNVKRVRAGPAEVEFFRPQAGSRFPANVMRMLVTAGCIAGSSQTTASAGAMASGTCDQSTFTNRDVYGLTEGYP